MNEVWVCLLHTFHLHIHLKMNNRSIKANVKQFITNFLPYIVTKNNPSGWTENREGGLGSSLIGDSYYIVKPTIYWSRKRETLQDAPDEGP